jgi:hypothetical protein
MDRNCRSAGRADPSRSRFGPYGRSCALTAVAPDQVTRPSRPLAP